MERACLFGAKSWQKTALIGLVPLQHGSFFDDHMSINQKCSLRKPVFYAKIYVDYTVKYRYEINKSHTRIRAALSNRTQARLKLVVATVIIRVNTVGNVRSCILYTCTPINYHKVHWTMYVHACALTSSPGLRCVTLKTCEWPGQGTRLHMHYVSTVQSCTHIQEFPTHSPK